MLNVFYINLNSRPDRKQHIENQMKLLNWKAKRFPAILHKDGAIGCALSHLALIRYAKNNNLDHILILEDDATFLNPVLFLTSLNQFLQSHTEFDVLLLAGNNMGDFQQINTNCVKVTYCKTTTAYLVQKHYYDTLINNFVESINLLRLYPTFKFKYAIDQHWSSLQSVHNWFLLTPLSIIQRPDVSDIEKCYTNYGELMLVLDKSKYTDDQFNYKTHSS